MGTSLDIVDGVLRGVRTDEVPPGRKPCGCRVKKSGKVLLCREHGKEFSLLAGRVWAEEQAESLLDECYPDRVIRF